MHTGIPAAEVDFIHDMHSLLSIDGCLAVGATRRFAESTSPRDEVAARVTFAPGRTRRSSIYSIHISIHIDRPSSPQASRKLSRPFDTTF